MTLAVIGAGFGRTGTLSLKLALEMLGFGPCYHMVEVFKTPGHAERWAAAASQTNVDWDDLLNGYNSAVDWPSTYFWRELAEYYPNAKIIHTERSTESWIKSVNETIFRAIAGNSDDGAHVDAQRAMARELVFNRTFGGQVDDRAHLARIYENHSKEVKRTIAPERLLVYQSGQGWEPICKFLGVPVPAAPYPKVNSTEEFQSRVDRLTKGE
jgi:Sulfotransferase domain